MFYIKQLPIVPPSKFSDLDFQFVVPRVLELTYTAWDIKGFADHVWRDADESLRDLITQRWAYNQAITPLPPELDEAFEQPDWVEDREDGCPLPPFRWNPEYRHRLQSELDAYFAMKYELNYDELLYILDPHHEDSMGPDFPGETFRVLKNKEKTKYGEFRTRKLVLEAWENKPWETPTHLEAVPITAALARRSRKPSALLLQTMAYIIDRHDPPRFRHTLRRTKMEKLLHLIEAEMELDLGREPIKDQFGPADNALREAACREADNRHYFHEIEEPITHPGAQSRVQYSYQKGENLFELLTAFREAQADHLEQINQLLAPFLELKSTQVEIRVTLYAAWNNLLLANTPILSDEAIIRAAREEWHEQKERYAIRDFEFGLAWLRQQGIVPTGRGKTVTNNLG